MLMTKPMTTTTLADEIQPAAGAPSLSGAGDGRANRSPILRYAFSVCDDPFRAP